MKRKVKGSFTVEAAVIVPIVLLIFGILLHILFYWHDKNILMGAAYETAVLGSGRNAMEESELEQHFILRTQGKLLLLARVDCEVRMEENKVVIAFGGKKKLSVVKAEYSINKTEPERYIRNMRKLKKLGEGVGNKN